MSFLYYKEKNHINQLRDYKNTIEKTPHWILPVNDEDKRQEELDKLNATQDEWKLRAMGTTIGCHTIVKKGTEDTIIKTYDLT